MSQADVEPQAVRAAERNEKTSIRNLTVEQVSNLRLLALFVAVAAIGALLSHGVLLRPENLSNILQQNAVLFVVVLAQFLIVVSGGFDLSVGAVTALASVIFVGCIDYGLAVSIPAALLAGLAVGVVNGVLVTFVRLPSFVVTLGTMQIGYSVAKMWTGGGTIQTGFRGATLPQPLLRFYSVDWLHVPLPVWLAIGILALTALYLRSSIGHFLFAVGGNARAARLAGIPVSRVRLTAYAVASLIASVGGLLFALRVGYGDPQAGTWLALDSIAAVSIGGVSLTGGEGSILSGFLGVLIIAMLDNIMNLLGVSVNAQPIVKGVIVIATVYIYSRRRS
ncbi:ABC transporter permease [Lichenifustis flavocetrariae]|uniref:ABC transporter permease n=1 Tax=Lichenifustis flavocetrariae TaxID=2949735 RepID=A0AA41Z8F1_9HYPH|nr:ABC transporter permease [Lichenifustis flavocetrariae]MCW6511217.1 ABC transporter permease [Lichenifustis flavocetrariae]